MSFYNTYSLEERKKIDLFFLSSINNYDYTKYIDLLIQMNNNYNKSIIYNFDSNRIRTKKFIEKTNEKFEKDIKDYLNLKYLKRYENNIEEIIYDPITIELLCSSKYLTYLKSDIDETFINILNGYKDKQKFNNLLEKIYKNYENDYYKGIMIFYFNQRINEKAPFSNEEINQIIEFFVNLEAFQKKLKINYEIIKISSLFKNLFSLKKENSKEKINFYYKALNIILDKKIVIKKIKQYKTIYASHIKREINTESLIRVNISNFKDRYSSNQLFFSQLLDIIYHELRHCYQSSEKDEYITFICEKERILLNYNYNFYLDNYSYLFSEIDADLYSGKCRKVIFDTYFPKLKIDDNKYREFDSYFSLLKYSNKLEILKEIDSLILNNSKLVEQKPILRYEYLKVGYSKPLILILNEMDKLENKKNIQIYNEIIINCLNRLKKEDNIKILTEIYNSFPHYISYIEIALKLEIEKINNYLSKLHDEKRRKIENRIKNYNEFINYYYLEILNIKNGLAKKYTK